MRSLKSYFKPPSFAQISNNSSPTPEPKHSREIDHPVFAEVSSSPLSDPPPSSLVSTSTPAPDTPHGPSAQLNASLSKTVSNHATDRTATPANETSFQSNLSNPPSSIPNSTSQRIIRGGKEVVISSDGEETDGLSDLEDPSTLFAPKQKQGSKNEAPVTKPARPDKAYLASLMAPKKYKNSIDDLVHDAVDDNEVEAKVAQVKASFVRTNGASTGSKSAKSSPAVNEKMLASALGGADEEDGPNLQRLMNAVRRTEALDQDRTWRFFERVQTTPTAPPFPKDHFPPGSNLAALREPESRARMIQSGCLEFASSMGRLPNDLITWFFLSIPIEPQEDLRKAYCRIIVNTPPEVVRSNIHPKEVDALFQKLGARPEALDFSNVIVEEQVDLSISDSGYKYRSILLSILGLLQDTSELFSVDARERAINILLRISLDKSLTQDFAIRSRLQSALTALLENVSESEIDQMEHQLGTTLYNTVKDPLFQNCMIQHILPTSPWISLLRYRLAMSFLLQKPTPLTEPIEEVLNPKRLVEVINGSRFKINMHAGNEEDCDYGELIALTQLLEVTLNTSLYDLHYKQEDTEKEFNAAIDQLASQLKTNFSAMKESGASHLKRMLAKGALETLYYRLIYSVRSKPPPKKTVFQTYGADENRINSYFNKMITEASEATRMPIRET